LRRFNSPKNVRERSRQPLPIWAPQTRTHASVCEGMRASQGAGSTAAAAFAIPDATPESTPTQHSPAPAAAPRGADDATPCHRSLPISEHVCARCAQQPTDEPTRRTRKRTRRRTRRRTQVPYMKTVSRSISSSVGFILRGRRPFRKRRCRSKREREPCRSCAARARGFEDRDRDRSSVLQYVSYILNIRVRAHVVRSGISSKRKGKILVSRGFVFARFAPRAP